MVQRKTAALLAAVAVLACFGAQLAWAAAEEDTLQYTEEFLKSKINSAMLHLPQAVKAARNGTLKKAAASPPKQVRGKAPTADRLTIPGRSTHRLYQCCL
jgi:hypothetical protein